MGVSFRREIKEEGLDAWGDGEYEIRGIFPVSKSANWVGDGTILRSSKQEGDEVSCNF